jgi:thioredoxin 1
MTPGLATFLHMTSMTHMTTAHTRAATLDADAAPPPTATGAAPYVDTERFAAMVEQAPGLALVDFTADWCPPCRRLAPHVDALARDLSESLTVVKVNVDDQPGIASRFSVLSVPTLIFFRGGQVVDRIVGAWPPEQLRAKVDQLRHHGERSI